MKIILRISLLLLLSIGILSCSAAHQEPIFQVSPVELFSGDKAKFKPFMKNAGAVKVKYRGEMDSIRLFAEVWVNGELHSIHPQIGGFLTEDMEDGLRAWDGEVIISIDKNENDGGHSRYTTESVFFDENGYVSYGYTFEAGEAHTSLGHIPLYQEERILPNEGEVAIWGIQATNQSILHTVSLAPEQIKKTDWAVVFKLAATKFSED